MITRCFVTNAALVMKVHLWDEPSITTAECYRHEENAVTANDP